MSGPVEEHANPTSDFGISTIEVKEGRTAQVGDLSVLRVLPTKKKRTIGPWCFVDLMSPDDIESPPPMEIGPHPHIGLATVTWLFAGSALHSDSLGSEQLISPGQLNLMTAGHGLAHAELGVETAPAHETNGVMGAQMWLAQPEATRHGSSRFEHLDELPEVTFEGGRGHILVGSFAEERSPATIDHPTVGMDVILERQGLLPAAPEFEYAIVPIDVPVKVDDAIVEPGALAYVPTGFDELHLESKSQRARVLILGGAPLGEPVKMWWNFVARTQDEITEAWSDWQEHNEARFGPVPSSLPRIDAPRPPWLRETS
ncbi:MAG: pirin family protein [Actinobacteria bacterium]|nr:MAG: pirin family protein [Actinomycetota bacterium]REK34292.1 MAG: pirin family protein [Actinomycetota bacterium]